MSNQPSNPTAEEALKFVTFFLRSYQEEFDTVLSTDSDLLSQVILEEHQDDMDLIFEQIDDRVIMKAVLNEDE